MMRSKLRSFSLLSSVFRGIAAYLGRLFVKKDLNSQQKTWLLRQVNPENLDKSKY
jgi:hypothetical protein